MRCAACENESFGNRICDGCMSDIYTGSDDAERVVNKILHRRSDDMTFNEYQEKAHRTSFDTEIGGDTLLYPVLGLIGEAGELANKIKKIYRDKNGVLNESDRSDILKETQDCTWYLAEIFTQLGVKFDDMVQANIAKLADRAERGVIGGSGDNR